MRSQGSFTTENHHRVALFISKSLVQISWERFILWPFEWKYIKVYHEQYSELAQCFHIKELKNALKFYKDFENKQWRLGFFVVKKSTNTHYSKKKINKSLSSLGTKTILKFFSWMSRVWHCSLISSQSLTNKKKANFLIFPLQYSTPLSLSSCGLPNLNFHRQGCSNTKRYLLSTTRRKWDRNAGQNHG